MDIAIRPATPDDEPFRRRLFEETRSAIFAIFPPDAPQRAFLVDMQFRAREAGFRSSHPNAETCILVDDEGLIGTATVAKNGAIWLLDLAIVAERRNQGIGTRVLQELQAHVEQAGKSLILHVEETNLAKRLYDRLGFREVSRQPPYIEMEWSSSPVPDR